MEIIESLISCKDRVKAIMEKYPKTRDSDKLLWLAYMSIHHDLREKLGKDAYETLKEIIMNSEAPPPESIRRVRQKIQEGGELLGELQAQKIEQMKEVGAWATKKKKAHTFILELERP